MTHHTDYQRESPEAIKSEIERTRSQMSNKIDTLQERLHPDNLKYQAQEAVQGALQEGADAIKHYLQDNANELRDAVVDSFKRNPVPTALVGLGLGWILLESLSSRDKGNSSRKEWRRMREEYTSAGWQGAQDEKGRVYGGYASMQRPSYGEEGDWSGDSYSEYGSAHEGQNDHDKTMGDRVQEFGSTVKDKAGQAVERIQDTAGQLADQVSGKTQALGAQTAQLGEQTSRQVQQMGRQATHILEDNPLAVGAAALALGAAIGLLLPATRRENEMVGELRDQMVEKGRAVASEVAHRVQEVVEEAKPEVQQLANRVIEELEPEIRQFGEKVTSDLKQAGEEALATATNVPKAETGGNPTA